MGRNIGEGDGQRAGVDGEKDVGDDEEEKDSVGLRGRRREAARKAWRLHGRNRETRREGCLAWGGGRGRH